MAPKLRKGTKPGKPKPGLVEAIQLYGKHSYACDDSEAHEAERLAVLLRDTMVESTDRFVRERGSLPLLQFYSNDGTPIKLPFQVATEVSGVPVRRGGKSGQELLVQSTFHRYCDTTGAAHTICSFPPPLPLTNGKTALAVFSMAKKNNKSLRERGHRGIAIQQYCFDRANFSALRDFFQAHHQSTINDHSESWAEAQWLFLQEWVEGVGCSLHDAHNSLKWGLNFKQYGKDVLKSVFIIIQSLRNGFDLISENVCTWLLSHVAFTERSQCVSPDKLYAQWTALGVEPKIVTVLSEDLQLSWDRESQLLLIAKDWAQRKDAMEQISGALLGVWHFRTFSDSRWVSVGTSCRAVAAGLLTGLPSLVDQLREDPKISDFYIGGVSRLDDTACRFIILASLVSYVSDAALCALFEDPRLALTKDAVVDAMSGEVEWLESLDGAFWETLASAFRPEANVSGTFLRSQVLSCSHTSFAFFHWRALVEADRYPWCLARGDVVANLRKLKAGPEPEQPTAWKIWKLLHGSFGEDKLQHGLRLLAQASWATSVVEQGHAQAAVLKRMHQQMEAPRLIGRAYIGSMRKLLPKVSVEEKGLVRLRRKLAMLSRKNPNKSHGRQEFFGDLVSLSRKAVMQERRGAGKHLHKKIMKAHGGLYEKMTTEQRDSYNRKADLKRGQSSDRLVEEKASIVTTMRLTHNRIEDASNEVPPMALSSCRLTDGEVAAMTLAWKQCDMSRNAVTAYTQEWLKAPEVVEEPTLLPGQYLFTHSAHQNSDAVRPGWLARVCTHRADFEDTIWAIEQDGLVSFYRFMFAFQSPHYISFQPLEKVKGFEAAQCGLVLDPALDSDSEVEWQATFEVAQLGLFMDWSELGISSAEQVTIIVQCVAIGNLEVACDLNFTPLPEFLDSLAIPHVEKATKDAEVKPPAKKKARQDFPPETLLKFPWLATPEPKRAPKAQWVEPTDDETLLDEEDVLKLAMVGADSDDELDDEEMEDLYVKLEAKRAQWETAHGKIAAQAAFKVRTLQGHWTIEHTGDLADFCMGERRGGEAKKFCHAYQLQDTMRFSMHFYGEAESFLLASTWCAKMSYFFDIYLSQAEEDYIFTDEDVNGWIASEQYVRLVERLPGRQRAGARKIDKMRPVRLV